MSLCVFLQPWHWDHRPTFYVGAGDSNTGPPACIASALTYWAISPDPRMNLLLITRAEA